MYILTTFVYPVGAEPRQFGPRECRGSLEEVLHEANRLVEEIHEVLLTEGYDVYCEIAG